MCNSNDTTPLLASSSRSFSCTQNKIPIFYQVLLVFGGCLNKVPQTRWLKTTEMDSTTVLEARSLKSRCQKGHSPSKGSRRESFPVSSRLLAVASISGVPLLVATLLQSPPLSLYEVLPVSVSLHALSSSYKDPSPF